MKKVNFIKFLNEYYDILPDSHDDDTVIDGGNEDKTKCSPDCNDECCEKNGDNKDKKKPLLKYKPPHEYMSDKNKQGKNFEKIFQLLNITNVMND